MKNIPVLLMLTLLADDCLAYADAYLSVNDMGAGLCLSADSLDAVRCGNMTVTLDGTMDHTVYILPDSAVTDSSTNQEKFAYMLLTPVNLLVGGAGFLLVTIAFTISLFWLVTNMRHRRM